MCEYCNGVMFQEPNMPMLESENNIAVILLGQLFIGCLRDGEGWYNLFDKSPICRLNYCPMCGRKLKEDAE